MDTLPADRIDAAKDTMFQELREQEQLQGDESGTVPFRGERFNIMGADYFMNDIYLTLAEIYGDGTGGILHSSGQRYGEELLDLIENTDPATMFGRTLGLLAFLGYSVPSVNTDTVIFPSSPTADAHTDADTHVCYFLAGILTGAATVFDDDDLRFTEDLCQGAGDEHCVFRLQ